MKAKKSDPAVSGLYIPPPSALASLSDPQVALTEVLQMLFPDDAALHRAVSRLRRMRYIHPAVAFDGLDATFQSSSQGDAEYHRVGLDDDGQEPTIACTCPGRGHLWCIHRLRFRLELAELALRDPVELLERVMSQTAQWYDVPAPASAPPAHTVDQHVSEVQPPAWLSDYEPPPPIEADRGGAHDTVAHPRMAAPSAQAEVEALLAAIEADYPL